MSQQSDTAKLVRELRREGFSVEITGSGHWEVRASTGERITTFSQTPGDRRWRGNAVAPIRRWKRSRGINPGRLRLYGLVPIDTHGVESEGRAASREVQSVVAVPIHTGDTESSLAAQYGASLSSVEAANSGQFPNPDLIYAGDTLIIPSGGSWAPASTPESVPHIAPSSPSPSYVPQAAGSPSGSGFSVPGMSPDLVRCIAFRESTNGTNPAAHGNVFGIIPASGYNVAGDSLAQQEEVAGEIYMRYGGAAWSADGCPGT